MKQALLCLAAVLLAGCAKNIDTEDAVKQSVIKDISSKVDVGHMDVNVDSVSFRDKEADATLSFKPKGAPDAQAMVMQYQLERQGDEWHIKSRDMKSHGEQQQQVQAPPLQPGQTTLPAGHMAIQGAAPGAAGGQTQLPPGHPAVPNGTPKQ